MSRRALALPLGLRLRPAVRICGLPGGSPRPSRARRIA